MNGVEGAHGSQNGAVPCDGQKLRKAAQDFESVLLSNLLEQMEQAVHDETSESGGDLKALGLQQLARNWAEAGGVGIARLILPQLEKQAECSNQLKVRTLSPMITRAGPHLTADE